MGRYEIIYQGALVVAGLLCLGVASYAWRHRDRRTAKLLVGVLLSVVFWTVMAGLVSVFSGTTIAKFATRFLLVGVVGSVLFLFLLSLRYTGREEYISWRSVALLLLEPAFVIVASWAPQSRDLVYAFGATDPGSFTGYAVTYGPLFLAHTIYSYVLLTASAAMLVSFAVRSEYLYQRQVAAILVAVFAPWVGNAVFLFGPVTFDLTPVAFAVTGLSLWWAIFSQDFLDLVPVARGTVVDNLNAGVLVLDRNDRVVDVNPRGRALLEIDDAAIGRPVADALASHPAICEAYTVRADHDEREETAVVVDGRDIRVDISPLSNQRNERIGHLLVVEDISERKRRQRELQRQNEQLDQFASVVSHDLRNPLNVASSRLELGIESGDEEHLHRVAQAHRRMDRIIDDVLTLAREGKGITDTERTSLAAVATDAWDHVSTPEATLEIEGDRPLVADPDRLQRAFENLFRNAVEHGGPDVTVRVGTVDGGFYVEDDGPGIPEDDLDQVFENGYTTSGDGTGFGLAIVESIVEAHGWSISAVAGGSSGPASNASGGSGDDRGSSSGARFEVTGVSRATDQSSGDAPVDGGANETLTTNTRR